MRIPPYGKPLRDFLVNGGNLTAQQRSVWLYIGDKSWEKGKISAVSRSNCTLVLPPNANPESYDWPVMGCEILVIETSQCSNDYIDSILQILLDYDAAKVVLISFNQPITVYKRDF
jgi:hypothetical protein